MDEDVKMVTLARFSVRSEPPFNSFEDDKGQYSQTHAERVSLTRKAVWAKYLSLELMRTADPDEIVDLRGFYFGKGSIQVALRGTLPNYATGVVAAMRAGGRLITIRFHQDEVKLAYGYAHEDRDQFCLMPNTNVPRHKDIHMLWLADTVMSLQNGKGMPTHKTQWWPAGFQTTGPIMWPFRFADAGDEKKYEVLFPSLCQV